MVSQFLFTVRSPSYGSNIRLKYSNKEDSSLSLRVRSCYEEFRGVRFEFIMPSL